VNMRKRGVKRNAYGMTKDLLDATPGLVLGVGVAGLIPKLYP
jgi:hypothetical protein